MNRFMIISLVLCLGVPHVSGDEPDLQLLDSQIALSVPHVSGDEPADALTYKNDAAVFPTRVGMNRAGAQGRGKTDCVPHASGDEPSFVEHGFIIGLCSPREWG